MSLTRADVVAAWVAWAEHPNRKATAIRLELALAVYAPKLRLSSTELREVVEAECRTGKHPAEALMAAEGPA